MHVQLYFRGKFLVESKSICLMIFIYVIILHRNTNIHFNLKLFLSLWLSMILLISILNAFNHFLEICMYNICVYIYKHKFVCIYIFYKLITFIIIDSTALCPFKHVNGNWIFRCASQMEYFTAELRNWRTLRRGWGLAGGHGWCVLSGCHH